MAHNSNESTQPSAPEPGDAQLRSLISLFNWLVGEVVTARIMILRLAADLVRLGVLPVEEINGVPLTQEIIDSVMSNFPQDPVWQALGQRLRNSLDALRSMDMTTAVDESDESLDDADGLAEDLAALAEEDDEEDDLDAEEEPGAARFEQGAQAQVIYRDPEQPFPEGTVFPRTSRFPGSRHN